MTTDLFGPTGAELAQTGARQFKSAYTNWRTGAPSQTSATVAHSGAKSVGVRRFPMRADQRTSTKKDAHSSLREQAEILYADLSQANAEVAAAEACQAPYEAAFQAAHAALLSADWTPAHRALRRPLYDARLDAGHAWHPHRKKLREAQAWAKALLSDLKAINEAIERREAA